MRRPKRAAKMLLIGMLAACMPSVVCLADGSINENEEAVISAASGEYVYEGSVYQVDSTYLVALRAYFAKDGVDLTAAQKESCLAQISGNIAKGVEAGYLVKVREADETDQTSQIQASKKPKKKHKNQDEKEEKQQKQQGDTFDIWDVMVQAVTGQETEQTAKPETIFEKSHEQTKQKEETQAKEDSESTSKQTANQGVKYAVFAATTVCVLFLAALLIKRMMGEKNKK